MQSFDDGRGSELTSEPVDLLGVQRVRRHDVASRVEDGLGSDLGAVEVLARLDRNRKLDVEADEIALLRDNHDLAKLKLEREL